MVRLSARTCSGEMSCCWTQVDPIQPATPNSAIAFPAAPNAGEVKAEATSEDEPPTVAVAAVAADSMLIIAYCKIRP